MLRDPMLHDELEALIRQQHHSAEYAVSRTLRRYAKVFQQLENVYLAERAHDVFDLESSLLANLLGRRRESLADLETPAIVLAHNHPSGDAEPSLEDHEVTRRLVRAGQLLGVPILDHVVLGLGAWTSLREASGGLFGGRGWENGEAG